jgi:hypothetical protein
LHISNVDLFLPNKATKPESCIIIPKPIKIN